MNDNNDHRTHHHVQLPGGRQIEVVYLESDRAQREHGASQAAQPARASSDTPAEASTSWHDGSSTSHSPTRTPGETLHVCPRCAGGLVSPVEWSEESPGRWHILMRCPDCDLMRDGIFGQALVERLDEELDRATGALLSDLKRLTHANMVEEIELFSTALRLDLIGPSDF